MKIGDLVILNSGSVPMTVVALSPELVRVVYSTREGQIQSLDLPLDTIKLVPDAVKDGNVSTN